jgi:hypothetical protein
MDDLTGSQRAKVDRLPILVSGQDVVKLLAVPKLQDGTAASMVQAITHTIDDWGLRDRIKSLCFDTTSANTGTKDGACIRLQAELGRQFWFGLVWFFNGTSAQKRPLVPRVRLNFVCGILLKLLYIMNK